MANAPWRSPRSRHNMGEAIAEELAQTPKVVAGAYTLEQVDARRHVEANGSAAQPITVPKDKFRAGQQVLILQTGTGLVTVVAGTGMTVNSQTTLKSAGRYAGVTVVFSSPTVATVIGQLAAA